MHSQPTRHIQGLTCPSGNRFQGIMQDEQLPDSVSAFSGIKDLAVEETLMSWAEICHLAGHFESLKTLFAGTNQLRFLPATPLSPPLTSSLTSLNLEYNDFTAFSDLASLAALGSLRSLHLKGNNIAQVVDPESDAPPPVFPR